MIALVCIDPFGAGAIATFVLACWLVAEVVARALLWAADG